MSRKRYSDEVALKFLREIDVHLHDGLDVVRVLSDEFELVSPPGETPSTFALRQQNLPSTGLLR